MQELQMRMYMFISYDVLYMYNYIHSFIAC